VENIRTYGTRGAEGSEKWKKKKCKKEFMSNQKEMQKRIYVEPKVLVTYDKEELKDIMMPHGSSPNPSGCGCGCG
jgi:hypothetical protein